MLDQKPIDQSIPIPKVDSLAPKSFTPNKPPLSIAGRADRKNVQTNGTAQGKPSKVSAPLTIQPAFKDSDASQNAMSQFLVKYDQFEFPNVPKRCSRYLLVQIFCRFRLRSKPAASGICCQRNVQRMCQYCYSRTRSTSATFVAGGCCQAKSPIVGNLPWLYV